ncbi:hypothetical protein Bca4012_039738 [Brassica carinata]|uniref:Uncharacterized protein n=1 Tax=Brassica carinata TaxID=52824 RepID=A0A8X7W8X9_BRACI|nr:hypothetical protein Bca52824_007977 [Brassica carinata]
MPYYTRDEDEVDDFDEFDPTPYSGGYDITVIYGRPIPPSDDTCYPLSSADDEDFEYETPEFTSYHDPSAYAEEALRTEYSSYSRPKPRPDSPGGGHVQGERPDPGYGREPESEYGSGYGGETEVEYGRRPESEYEKKPSFGEERSEYERKPSYGRSEEQEEGSYREPSYGGSEEEEEGGYRKHSYGEEQEEGSYRKPSYGDDDEEGSYGRKKYGDNDSDDDGKEKQMHGYGMRRDEDDDY